jgi:hypothetical protein
MDLQSRLRDRINSSSIPSSVVEEVRNACAQFKLSFTPEDLVAGIEPYHDKSSGTVSYRILYRKPRYCENPAEHSQKKAKLQKILGGFETRVQHAGLAYKDSKLDPTAHSDV